jgi:hypothetical protein
MRSGFAAEILFLLGGVASAAPLDLTLFDSTQFAPPGTHVIFQGTITNDIGFDLFAGELSLNFASFDPTFVSPGAAT